jgi:hypothetical protein
VAPSVVGEQLEARRGVSPDLLEIGLDGFDALAVQAVQAAGAFRAVGDQAGVLEQPQVSGDGGAADRELVGELTDRPIAGAEQLDDRPSVRVTEGVEGIARQGAQRDC